MGMILTLSAMVVAIWLAKHGCYPGYCFAAPAMALVLKGGR